jgi:hypothetical protein
MSVLLEVKNLRVYYGAIEAVKGIDFSLELGQITHCWRQRRRSTTLRRCRASRRQRRFHLVRWRTARRAAQIVDRDGGWPKGEFSPR